MHVLPRSQGSTPSWVWGWKGVEEKGTEKQKEVSDSCNLGDDCFLTLREGWTLLLDNTDGLWAKRC